MTEQPDTAAIRAEWRRMDSYDRTEIAWRLMDALDAARANIERAHAHRENHALAAGEAIARAEAAEAERDEWREECVHLTARAEAAEARITNALAVCNDHEHSDILADFVRRALTGEQ